MATGNAMYKLLARGGRNPRASTGRAPEEKSQHGDAT